MKPPTQRILPTSPKTRVLGIMQDRSNSALADFPAFQNLPEDIKKKQLESYKFVRATFPFYIPYAQHVMYLSRLDNRKGEYWGDASHFLLCNKAHGFPLWSEFEKQIRSIHPPKVLCKPHISTKMANLILKHKFGQRQQVNQLYSHGSFLLAQLPFQPVLLFQWLTLMMRHVLMFELEMEEFYIMPVPVEFKPHLMSLHKLLKTTQRNIGFLFDYLQHQVESEPDIYVGNLKVFEIILNGVRAFLGFWQNHDGCKYVRNLKMKCWKHLDPDAELFQLKKGVMPLKKRNFLFNLDFWRGPSPKLTLFGNSNEQLVRIRPNKTHDEIWREVLKNKKINLEKIVDSFIIDCLEMPNVSFKFLMKRNGEFRELVQKVMHWSSGLAVEIRDRGIIGLVINLNTKIEYSHALFKTITWIEKKCKKSVNTLGNNWEQYYEFFDVDNIEPLITKLIGKPLRLQSDFEKLDPTVTAEPTHLLEFQYETRIQKIVLKCIKPHLEIKNYENEKDDAMRDWQVAQFLLPCFVSLFREISNSESPNDDLRVWYAKFLDKLIGTYEDKNLGFRKSSWKNILEDIEATPALKESYYEKNHQNLLNFFKRVSEDFYERIKICPTAFGHLAHCGYFRAFYEVLEKSCGENKTQSNDISTEPSVYWNWLMWDFFGRMDSAMQEATKQSTTDGGLQI